MCLPGSVGSPGLHVKLASSSSPVANTPWSQCIPRLTSFLYLHVPVAACAVSPHQRELSLHQALFRGGICGQSPYHPQPLTVFTALFPQRFLMINIPRCLTQSSSTSSPGPLESQFLSQPLQVFSLQGQPSHPEMRSGDWPFLQFTLWALPENDRAGENKAGVGGCAVRRPHGALNQFLYLDLSFPLLP